MNRPYLYEASLRLYFPLSICLDTQTTSGLCSGQEIMYGYKERNQVSRDIVSRGEELKRRVEGSECKGRGMRGQGSRVIKLLDSIAVRVEGLMDQLGEGVESQALRV